MGPPLLCTIRKRLAMCCHQTVWSTDRRVLDWLWTCSSWSILAVRRRISASSSFCVWSTCWQRRAKVVAISLATGGGGTKSVQFGFLSADTSGSSHSLPTYECRMFAFRHFLYIFVPYPYCKNHTCLCKNVCFMFF